ncbi:hypothetical protein EYF80_014266 [Liparis tanakae]|uniref:Uncharacterized protein n=1 Tax=Liparis tanakae TaxID=230148 RepID=A0A4Z2IDI9_9TELE|nr:hypothetical protein EYF80_014266 [Liparis tanakae]
MPCSLFDNTFYDQRYQAIVNLSRDLKVAFQRCSCGLWERKESKADKDRIKSSTLCRHPLFHKDTSE